MKLHPLLKLGHSLTFRLALIYAGLFALSIALLFGAVYWIAVLRPLNEAERLVSREATALAETYIVAGREALQQQLETRGASRQGTRPFHAFIAPDGSVVSADLPSWPRQVALGWRRIEADLYVDGDEDDHEALVLDRQFADGARLLVGRDIEFIEEREELLREGGLWIAAITALLAVAGGVLMSLAVTRRLDAVTRTARRVIAGDLGERVPLRGTGDDFDHLAETLNLMLARIEELVESVRRVSDSIAHELRTPLARLHADLDELGRSDGEASRQRLIQQAVDEAARLQSVFDALLRIARIESGRHTAGMRPVDLSALLRDAAEFHAPDAEDKGIGLLVEVDEALRVDADPDLLFQAVSNIIDNALKHTPADGTVRLEGRVRARHVLIVVSDTGPGIAPEHRPRVTERFYRVPNTAEAPGAGLGLSLVAAVAGLHKARFGIADAEIGTRIELELPLGR